MVEDATQMRSKLINENQLKITPIMELSNKDIKAVFITVSHTCKESEGRETCPEKTCNESSSVGAEGTLSHSN